MLFIENPYLKEFESKVQKVENNNIVLEQTAFYAKSGGQPGDVGKIKLNEKEISVIDTMYDQEKNIIHVCDNSNDLNIGEIIKGKINWEIRYKHMRMHSALHLLCSLIPYDVTGGQISFEKSRLDFNAEDKIEKEEIENKINQLVKDDHKISYQWITNEELDKQPELVRTMSVKPPRTNNKIRLVKIGNIDLQPCGGTHVKKTGEIKLVKITRTKRIQDGVVRIEFVSGDTALDYAKQHDVDLARESAELKDKAKLKETRHEQKQELREKLPILVENITACKIGTNNVDETVVVMTEPGKPNFCSAMSEQYDEFFHISLGEKLIEKDPWMVYCGVFEDGDKIRAVIYSGEQVGKDKKAGDIAKTVSEVLGGAGGGNQRFAQGGGKDKSKKNDAIEKAKTMVLGV